MAAVVNVAINHAGGEPTPGPQTSSAWTFTPVPPPALTKDTASNIAKWGLETNIRLSRFAFDKKFQAYEASDFLNSLFTDSNVRQQLEVCTRRGTWVPLQTLKDETALEHEVVDATWVSLDNLLRFRNGTVVRENDMIVKCFDETYEGIIVSDELRKVFLAQEESDFFDDFSEEERGELLYRLLGHLVIGGPLCQYEDVFKPYIDTVREIYKSLVKVVRDDNKTLSIISHCYKVTTPGLFPNQSEHSQDFCYVCIDPITRWVTVLYGAWDD